MIRFAFLVTTLLISSVSFSQSNNEIYTLLEERAQALALSENSVWLKLVHYEENRESTTGLMSVIHTDTFFNSENGRIDPAAELVATLQAFTQPETENLNSHAQCVFRGRYVWLDKQLDFSAFNMPRYECEEYNEWSLDNTTESISIIFATGYLKNPASYYGHILLKFNSSKAGNRTILEDTTVNYGAIVPENEGPIPYIMKGLFGGYQAGFSNIEYYFHNHNYGENEQRNLWEYELNLDKDDVELIVAHSWELIRQEFTYFFLRENCAYQMAKLLEIVEGVDVMPKNRFWSIPQTLIQNINTTNIEGEPLVRSVIFHPSRQTRLYTRFSSLNKEEENLVERVVKNIDELQGEGVDALNATSKLRVLYTLLDYYQFVRDEDLLEEDINNINYRKVLAEIFLSDSNGTNELEFPESSPHLGRRPSQFRMGGINNSEMGKGLSLVIRPAYYDSLDSDYGHIRNSTLKMGEINLAILQDKLFLRSLNIISIESSNDNATGLPGDGNDAWRLKLSIEQQSLSCQDCLIARISADKGYTFSPTDRASIGVFGGGFIQNNRNGFGALAANVSIVMNYEFNDRVRLQFSRDLHHYFDSTINSIHSYRLASRYRTSQNTALRFTFQKNIATESSIAFEYFW
ncbi:DUF4105 domain-containing protein [Gammaproteobacteria bacterium]|nr:DUF4105 domain-containing protein [Gammaproteobacteria bacterium]